MSQPGWYADNANPNVTRYWSGAQWTALRTWDGTRWIEAASAPVPAASSWSAATTAVQSQPGPAMPIRRISAKAGKRTFLTLGGAALVVIGCVLPWASQNNGFTTQTISGTSAGGGQLDLVLGLVVAMIAVLFLTGRAGFKANVTSAVLSALILVIGIANAADIERVIKKESAASSDLLPGSSPGTTVGLGIIFVIIGGGLALVGTVLAMRVARKDARLGRLAQPVQPI